MDSVRTRRPVMEPDLASSGVRRWPAYAPAAHQRGIRGVYAFPLQVGVACLGALDVYRDRVEPVSPDTIDDGQTFADIALTMLVGDDPPSAPGVGVASLDDLLTPSMEVYQAQGMVMVDLGVSLADALVRLRAYAFVEGRPVAEVARDVVAGRAAVGSRSCRVRASPGHDSENRKGVPHDRRREAWPPCSSRWPTPSSSTSTSSTSSRWSPRAAPT